MRTAPSINSEVGESGIIEGLLGSEEVESLVKRLRGGSVDARLHAEAIEAFRNAKLGLLFHWGLDALPSPSAADKGATDDEKRASKFSPDGFNPDVWISSAKAAGAKYLGITVKQADGFCLFDSRLTSFDAVEASPYAKDPLRLFVDAAKRGNMKVYLQFSLADRHHPDFAAGKGQGDWKAYVRLLPGPDPRALHQLRRDRRPPARRVGRPARGRLGPAGDAPPGPRAATGGARRRHPAG